MKSIRSHEPMSTLKEFPCLGKFDENLIVLFVANKCGTVVWAKGNEPFHKIGEYLSTWAMENFVKYNGEIILSNIDS